MDGISLDQLRTFVVTVDEGSFSAAGRRLGRAQSAVSELIRSLEIRLGVELFDRDGRYPRLTGAGDLLLPQAREIIAKVDIFKSYAKGMATGLEAELSVVIDVFFPIHIIAEAAKDFRERFPTVPLRLFVEALGGTVEPILDRRANVGIVGSLPVMPSGIATEPLGSILFNIVASADHPLSLIEGPISKSQLERHVQLILTDRTELSAGREFGVMSSQTWRLADLFAKHTFLINGLGWGGMPEHAVKTDIEEGRLVSLIIEDLPAGGLRLPVSIAYRSDDPPGPAGRWFIGRLTACSNDSSIK
ncbi:LysR family transcriptional regulator [Rhizobium leguminosarum]